MSRLSEIKMGYYFEWNTQIPSESSVSPVFTHRDYRFRVQILHEGDALNCISLDQLGGGEQFLHFIVDSCTECNNESSLIIYSLFVTPLLLPIFERIHNYVGKIGADVRLVFHFKCDDQLSAGFSNDTNSQLVRSSSNLLEIPCLKSLSEDFSKLLDAESGQDVVLKCGDSTVRAHKIVLESRSKVFESMLQSDMIEGRTGHVEVNGVDSDIFQDFMRYVYTGYLSELNVDKTKKLYGAGNLYAVDSLKQRCSTFLCENLTPETACEYLDLADGHSDKELKERVISYILETKTPLRGKRWLAFSVRSPAVAVEVLNRFVEMQDTF